MGIQDALSYPESHGYVIVELATLLLSYAADVSTAEEMCEIDKELWTAAPIESDDEDAELLEVLWSAPVQEKEKDDSTYRVSITLCKAKEYMEELEYFIQENQPAMQSLVGPTASPMKVLSSMSISMHTVQLTLDAFVHHAPCYDVGASSAGGRED